MDDFTLDDQGVWFLTPSKKEGEPPTLTWVCSPLHIDAITRDHHNENHGKLLRFYDYDNNEHIWPMPMKLLAGDGSAYREVLLSGGLQIKEGRKGRELLTQYIQQANPEKRMRCVHQLGWYENLYIFPNETLGESTSESIVFQPNVPLTGYHENHGTLEEWQTHIATYCVDNSRLSFAVSTAFAAPLLHLLGEESGGFNLCGPSSGGKTTVLRVAQSVYGSDKMLQSWRATSNGLESIAAHHNDALLCLDELGKLEPKIAGEIAYLLANGTGKQRSNRSGYSKPRQCWRLLFLSSGEISLPDLIRQGGQKVRGGHEVRVIDISTLTGKYGAFESLHFEKTGDTFSRMLTQNAGKYYGTAAKSFLTALLKDLDGNIDRLKILIDEFKKTNAPLNADGQVLRVLNRVAVVAAAGKLATELEITGWPEEESFWGAQQCLESWLSNRGGVTNQEGREILKQIRRFFEQHGDSRFPSVGIEGSSKTINRAGYKKQILNQECFCVFSETFKSDVCNQCDTKIAISILLEREWLIPSSGGKATRSENLPCSEGTTRCYVIDATKVFSDEL